MITYKNNITIWDYLIPGSWDNNRKKRKVGFLYIEDAEVALNKAFKELDIPFNSVQHINTRETANKLIEKPHIGIVYVSNGFESKVDYNLKLVVKKEIELSYKYRDYEDKVQEAVELAEKKYFAN